MSEKPIIKRLTRFAGNGIFQQYEIGIDGVTEIKDESVEYSNALYIAYSVYSNNKIRVRLEYCTVEVVYE
jgi:hypothetical protein